MTNKPLVSLMIATRNRAEDLRNTLVELRKQIYPSLELVVIDDASDSSLEPLVREMWPGALRFERMERNVGMCQGRTRGLALSTGDYVVQLDDDSHFTRPDDVERAVAFLESHPEVGLVAFQIFNGEDLPSELLESSGTGRYGISFVGCGGMFRRKAVETVGGYTPFLQNEWEDNELSLRYLKAGWAIYFFPSVLIHHHLSTANRRTARTWMRGFRNKLWAILMHLPLGRLPFEALWVVSLAAWDSIRLLRPHRFVQGMWECAVGAGMALRYRTPMDALCLLRYDALRFRSIGTLDEWNNPPVCSPWHMLDWLRSKWWNRPRQRSFWDRSSGDQGSCATVKFSHEYQPLRTPEDPAN